MKSWIIIGVFVIQTLLLSSCGYGSASDKEAEAFDNKTEIEESLSEEGICEEEILESDRPETEKDPDQESGFLPLEERNASSAYEVDYKKISPMLSACIGEESIAAAQEMIDAFFAYETSVQVELESDPYVFLNEIGYILNCTCPMFEAFTNFEANPSLYNAETKEISWEYYIEKEELDRRVAEFTELTEEYLSMIDENDTDAMKALLLYLKLTKDTVYDYGLVGEAYLELTPEDEAYRSSTYSALYEKSGICYGFSQALMFLYIQAGLDCGTVAHMGGNEAHVWTIVGIDGKYYYCDPTWEENGSLKYFGMTAQYRYEEAGGYDPNEGHLFSVNLPEVYDINDTRFDKLRDKAPIEISKVLVNKDTQEITLVGYDYEYTYKTGQ